MSHIFNQCAARWKSNQKGWRRVSDLPLCRWFLSRFLKNHHFGPFKSTFKRSIRQILSRKSGYYHYSHCSLSPTDLWRIFIIEQPHRISYVNNNHKNRPGFHGPEGSTDQRVQGPIKSQPSVPGSDKNVMTRTRLFQVDHISRVNMVCYMLDEQFFIWNWFDWKTLNVIDEMLDRCEGLIRFRHFWHTFTCTLNHGTFAMISMMLDSSTSWHT